MRNSRAAAIALIILSLFMAFPACRAPETENTSTISVSAEAAKTIAAEGSVDITLYRFTLENNEHGLSYVSGYIAEGGSFTAERVPSGEWTARGEAYIGTSDAPVRVAESKAVSFTVSPGSIADVHIPFGTLLDIDAESIAVTLVLPEHLQAEGTAINISYRITDMAGSMKAEGSASSTAASDGTYILSINPADLGQGSYLVSVTVSGGGEERTAVDAMRLIGGLSASGTLYFDTWTPEALPEPEISVSRLSATSGRITISNWDEYPEDTVAVVNGVEYPLAETIVIVIGEDEVAISVHMAYKGEEHYEDESLGSEGTIPEYVSPKVGSPTISQSGNTVTIRMGTNGTRLYYRTVGSSSYTSTTNSSVSFSISSSGTVYAYCTAAGYSDSSVASKYCSYTAPACATPSISQSGNTVSISCSTSGATIYYRIGSSGSYARYTGSFSIFSSVTIYAYATASGYSTSNTSSRYCSYTAPTPSLPTPSISVTKISESSDHDDNTYGIKISNASSFPSGTTFSGSVEGYSWGAPYSGSLSSNSSGSWTIQLQWETARVTGVTIVASCSGYRSSSGNWSGRVD